MPEHLMKRQLDFANIPGQMQTIQSYFFFPFSLPLAAGAEAVDPTLEARDEGAAEVTLLPPLTLSSVLFYTKY